MVSIYDADKYPIAGLYSRCPSILFLLEVVAIQVHPISVQSLVHSANSTPPRNFARRAAKIHPTTTSRTFTFDIYFDDENLPTHALFYLLQAVQILSRSSRHACRNRNARTRAIVVWNLPRPLPQCPKRRLLAPATSRAKRRVRIRLHRRFHGTFEFDVLFRLHITYAGTAASFCCGGASGRRERDC